MALLKKDPAEDLVESEAAELLAVSPRSRDSILDVRLCFAVCISLVTTSVLAAVVLASSTLRSNFWMFPSPLSVESLPLYSLLESLLESFMKLSKVIGAFLNYPDREGEAPHYDLCQNSELIPSHQPF